VWLRPDCSEIEPYPPAEDGNGGSDATPVGRGMNMRGHRSRPNFYYATGGSYIEMRSQPDFRIRNQFIINQTLLKYTNRWFVYSKSIPGTAQASTMDSLCPRCPGRIRSRSMNTIRAIQRLRQVLRRQHTPTQGNPACGGRGLEPRRNREVRCIRFAPAYAEHAITAGATNLYIRRRTGSNARFCGEVHKRRS